jgi:hypothetical protein
MRSISCCKEPALAQFFPNGSRKYENRGISSNYLVAWEHVFAFPVAVVKTAILDVVFRRRRKSGRRRGRERHSGRSAARGQLVGTQLEGKMTKLKKRRTRSLESVPWRKEVEI